MVNRRGSPWKPALFGEEPGPLLPPGVGAWFTDSPGRGAGRRRPAAVWSVVQLPGRKRRELSGRWSGEAASPSADDSARYLVSGMLQPCLVVGGVNGREWGVERLVSDFALV